MRTLQQKIISPFLFFIILCSLFFPFFAAPQKVQAQWYVYNPTWQLDDSITAKSTAATAATSAKSSVSNGVTAVKTSYTGVQSYWTKVETWLVKTKEFLWDGLARSLAKAIISRMIASTVDWINNGFEGKPAFLTDPKAFFTGVANDEIGRYLTDKMGLDWLCSPFSLQIKIALQTKMRKGYKPPKCTLTDMIKNVSGFIKNNGGVGWDKVITYSSSQGNSTQFSILAGSNNAGFNTVVNRGTALATGDAKWSGWDNFMGVFGEPTNNPMGAFLWAENDMMLKVGDKAATKRTDINLGAGFMSWKRCTGYTGYPTCTDTLESSEMGPGGAAYSGSTNVYGTSSAKTDYMLKSDMQSYKTNFKTDEGKSCSHWQDSPCTTDKTETPGSTIKGMTDFALSAEWQQVINADEINEIFEALLNQLMKQFFAGGTSLLGMGSKQDNGKSKITEVTEADLIAQDAQNRALQNANDAQDAQTASNANNEQNNLDQQYANSLARGNDYLTWNEISSGRLNVNRTITNVALNKRTSQSSTQGGSSMLAVDGVLTNASSSGYTATADGTNNWWLVDLGAEYSIDKIIVYPRGDISVSSALGQYKVSILNSGNVPTWSKTGSTSDSTYIPIEISALDTSTVSGLVAGANGTPSNGRYVKIERTDSGPLQLTEVQVMGAQNLVVFDNAGSNVNIYLNSGEMASDYTGTLYFDSNGPVSGIKVFASMIKKAGSSENLISFDTIFSLLKMGVARVDKVTNQVQDVTPQVNPNLINQVVQIGDSITMDTKYYYAVVYDGLIKTIGQLRGTLTPGQYILRTEIRDNNNNNIDVNNIYFTVS
ncbi:MAG: discoidin domain-containing protein [bacterium]